MKEALELRKKIKGKKPTFIRQDAHKKAEISKNWRRPKGLQSKMRLKKRGYPRSVEIGWKSPAIVRGLHASGLKSINVHNIKDLSKLNNETDGVIIASTVGKNKKVAILNKCKELKLNVLNVADIDAYLKLIEESMNKTKVDKKTEEKAKEEKIKAEEKAASKEAKKKTEEKTSDEDSKKQAKSEKDKILTKKQ